MTKVQVCDDDAAIYAMSMAGLSDYLWNQALVAESIESRCILEMWRETVDDLRSQKNAVVVLDDAQRTSIERAAAEVGVWRKCRLAMVEDGKIIGYPTFSRADMAELARLKEVTQ